MTETDLQAIGVDALDERYGKLRLPQPRLERTMGASMRRYGQLTPLVGCARDGVVAVVDGFKRLHAARKIGTEVLTVRLLPLSERAAVAAVFGMNQQGRGLADLEEAWVVHALVRGHRLTQPEAGELLDRHKSWVCRRLALVERLDERVQQDLRVGLIPVSVARALVRLPRGNQPETAAAIHQHGLTTQDATLLVDLLQATVDREQQQAVLDSPREFLDAHRGGSSTAPADPRLGPAANRVRRTAAQVTEALTYSAHPNGAGGAHEEGTTGGDVIGARMCGHASGPRWPGEATAAVLRVRHAVPARRARGEAATNVR